MSAIPGSNNPVATQQFISYVERASSKLDGLIENAKLLSEEVLQAKEEYESIKNSKLPYSSAKARELLDKHSYFVKKNNEIVKSFEDFETNYIEMSSRLEPFAKIIDEIGDNLKFYDTFHSGLTTEDVERVSIGCPFSCIIA